MGWLWIGLLIGLLIGAGVLALVLRSVGRLTGTGLRSVVRLVVDGLAPGREREGVGAQRALARRLKRVGERTASGRRVAADELTVHVAPEDHAAIEAALGLDAASRDLAEFYRAHADRSNWIVRADPQVTIVRDISLRPRQSFVRASARVSDPAPSRVAPPAQAPRTADLRPPVASRPDDAVTDVLPAGLLADAGTSGTAVYPAGMLLGDLVVVHGTSVRTLTPTSAPLRLGRGKHNDLVLDRPGIGRDHLVIEARDDAWWIVPGTTPGGTALDGVPVEAPTPVRGSATLELGRGVRVRLSVEP
jgi:hypothetical protein